MYLMYLDMFDTVFLWCSLVNMLVPAFVPADYILDCCLPFLQANSKWVHPTRFGFLVQTCVIICYPP